MGNSTYTVQSVIDYVAVRGVPDPLNQAAGYGTELALTLATDTMNDLVNERFNWKWNSKVAAPFYTNTWQQDYPQIGLVDIGWLEDADRIDINNTQIPKPLRNMTIRRGLSRTNFASGLLNQLCWMYNSDLSYGDWPGPDTTYYPLVTTSPIAQNPPMAFIDANNNILVLTTIGTTGSVQPELPANSAEGTTVNDGTCVWTVASPNSQGFRVFPLPAATGPVFQVTPKYQQKPPVFTLLSQTLDPVPDDFAKYFRRAYEFQCKGASANPVDKKAFEQDYPLWLQSLEMARKQGDRELDAYGLLPATYPVESVYPYLRNPQDPSQPY